MYGQDAIIKVIRRQVEQNRVGHAYLFAGPRGTGKTSLARLLAKAVNCEKSKTGNPCKKCTSCKSIEQGRYMDLIEIDAASNRGIDEIRQLKERVGFSPSEGKYKVYIIDEVHMLTKDAFNALLKTLEEPPEHVIFILATTEPHKIPATILSRCQRFNFSLASEAIVIEKLAHICKQEGASFEESALRVIANFSGGSFRDAESLLDKVIGSIGVKKDRKVDVEDINEILGLAEEKQIAEFISALLEKRAQDGLRILNELFESGTNLAQLLRQSLERTRTLLLRKIAKDAGDFSLHDLLTVISELSDAESKLKFASVDQLPIEVAIVKICQNAPITDNILQKGQDAGTTKAPENTKKTVKKSEKKMTSSSTGRKAGTEKIVKEVIQEDISVDAVVSGWGSLIENIKPFNHHLSAFFKKARPIDIQGDKILLEVPFRFHKQRIESHKAQEIFEEVIEPIVGIRLGCVCEVTQENEQESETISLEKAGEGVVLEVLGDMLE